MPIVPYLKPQDTITQILRQTPAPAVSRRNPVVIGPEFSIFLNDGRDIAKETFASAGATHSYEDGNGVAIDLTKLTPHVSSVELYGENLEAQVASFGSGLFQVGSGGVREVRLQTNHLAGSGTLNASLDGRAVKVGDIVNVTNDLDAVQRRRQVVQLLGVVTPATPAGSLSILGDANNAQANPGAGSEYEKISGDADWTMTAPTTNPINPYKQIGGVYVVNGIRSLSDEFTVTVTTAGVSGTAVATISAKSSGQTATGIVSVNPGGGQFDFPLGSVGYTGVVLSFTVAGGTANLGDSVVVRQGPTYTTVAATLANFTIGGAYVAPQNRRYIVEVIYVDSSDFSKNVVRIYDTAGLDTATQVEDPETTFSLGASGLTLQLDSVGSDIYKGQKFYVDAVAEVVSTTQFDGLLLDGPIVDQNEHATNGPAVLTALTVFQRYTGKLDPTHHSDGVTNPLTATVTNWSYAATLGLNNTATGRAGAGDHSAFANGFGRVFVSYKALKIPTALEGAIELKSEDEILAAVGEAHIENWLGRGTLEAFNGNQSRKVYALRTAGDTVADFTVALKKIETSDNYYALAVLSDVEDVMVAVKDHCETMSNPTNRNFRRCYVGTDSPGAYLHWGTLSGGGLRLATLASKVLTIDAAHRSVSVFTEDDIGSTVTITGLVGSYEITSIISAYEAELDIAVGTTVGVPAGITLTRPDTPEATALYVQARSNLLNSRRCVNVWSDNPTVEGSTSTEAVPLKFVAAEIAGLRCALLPQQGLTMTEVLSITAAPGMYARFTPALLDDIAAEGTMVITQEAEGGDVFVRHQLTTKAESNAPLEYEDNVGVVVDEFGYAEKDKFRNYIGQRNATPDTIAAIRAELKQLAVEYTRVELVNEIYGPPVITFFDEEGVEGEVTVRRDADLADTLLTYVKLRVPLPLNRLNHYIDVETAVAI